MNDALRMQAQRAWREKSVPSPISPRQRAEKERQTWVRGSQLTPDEQRYVLELFPESRLTLKLTEQQWLEQTTFRALT